MYQIRLFHILFFLLTKHLLQNLLFSLINLCLFFLFATYRSCHSCFFLTTKYLNLKIKFFHEIKLPIITFFLKGKPKMKKFEIGITTKEGVSIKILIFCKVIMFYKLKGWLFNCSCNFK